MVTGAAGFLGSHLMLHHMDAGDSVLGIDNYSSSNIDSDHVKLIKARCHNHNFNSFSSLVTCDITDNAALSSVVYQRYCASRFDVIYNFACPASPPIYQADPIKTMMTCVVGLQNVLQIATYMKSKVVHASTSEVYGDPTCPVQSESYRGCVNSYGPRACYDEGKRAAEALCFDYLNKFGLDVRLVRIFNTYGPRMDPNDGRVVSNLICQALRGEKMTIYGEGLQTRSFCYVDDLIRGIVALADFPANPKTPINLGNPVEFTIRQLAQQISSKMSISNGISYLPMPVDDPRRRQPDIALAKVLLNWEPKVTLSEGLDKTIAYFSEQLSKSK
jgi:UDP-glucuronate decarboxylase